MTWVALIFGICIAGICANHNASNRYEMVADSVGIIGGVVLALGAIYFHYR